MNGFFILNQEVQKFHRFINPKKEKQYSTKFIQGKKIKDCMKKEIKNLIWFTYQQFNKTLSDMNWGCMIRCGQMMMISCLQRFFKLK